jgi:preprotein translocase subunit SecG
MFTLLLIIIILICIILMAVILMQSSKGTGLAGSIGGSSVTMAFGVRRTSDILSKATTVLATTMLVLSILINLMIGSGVETEGESVIQREAGQQQVPPTDIQPPPQQQIPGTEQPQQQDQPVQPDQEQAPGN